MAVEYTRRDSVISEFVPNTILPAAVMAPDEDRPAPVMTPDEASDAAVILPAVIDALLRLESVFEPLELKLAAVIPPLVR